MKALLTYEMVGTQGALTREESSKFYQVLSLMNALALTECVRPNPGDMSTLAPTSEKYYSPPLMIHHPRLYEVPEHPVPAVLAQSRRETIPIHDYTGAGTSFSAHHGTKTLRTNVSEMKALLTYEMVGTQGALTPQIH